MRAEQRNMLREVEFSFLKKSPVPQLHLL